MATHAMHLVADDPVNRSIWSDSVSLQRMIALRQGQPLLVGAQQAMPKSCDAPHFSASNPLPWVPDLVGRGFGNDHKSVLVVASSYNGFITGYSARAAVMPMEDYVAAKKAGDDGLKEFVNKFKNCVVDRDDDYYQPVLRDLLAPSGCVLDNCCLTDLCKASFVRRGSGTDDSNRRDKGDDSVVRNHWYQWTLHVAGVDDGIPLPYEWLWQRMQQCRVIVALGTIAEYGVLKIFQRMSVVPKVWSWNQHTIVPDHPTMTTEDWEYDYACTYCKLSHWLNNEDWWVLSGDGTHPQWFLLPVHHPASAIGRGNDERYLRTVPRLRQVVQQAVRVF